MPRLYSTLDAVCVNVTCEVRTSVNNSSVCPQPARWKDMYCIHKHTHWLCVVSPCFAVHFSVSVFTWSEANKPAGSLHIPLGMLSKHCYYGNCVEYDIPLWCIFLPIFLSITKPFLGFFFFFSYHSSIHHFDVGSFFTPILKVLK